MNLTWNGLLWRVEYTRIRRGTQGARSGHSETDRRPTLHKLVRIAPRTLKVGTSEANMYVDIYDDHVRLL